MSPQTLKAAHDKLCESINAVRMANHEAIQSSQQFAEIVTSDLLEDLFKCRKRLSQLINAAQAEAAEKQ